MAAVTAPSAWLNDIYALAEEGEQEQVIDALFTHIDDLLSQQSFEQCDDLLRTIDLSRLNSHLIVALLSITLAAADHLPYRKRLCRRARLRLEELAPGRVDQLLVGLKEKSRRPGECRRD